LRALREEKGDIDLVVTRAHDGWFGLEYSEQCPDVRGRVGTDIEALIKEA